MTCLPRFNLCYYIRPSFHDGIEVMQDKRYVGIPPTIDSLFSLSSIQDHDKAFVRLVVRRKVFDRILWTCWV